MMWQLAKPEAWLMVVGSKGVRNDHMNALVVGLHPECVAPLLPTTAAGTIYTHSSLLR